MVREGLRIIPLYGERFSWGNTYGRSLFFPSTCRVLVIAISWISRGFFAWNAWGGSCSYQERVVDRGGHGETDEEEHELEGLHFDWMFKFRSCRVRRRGDGWMPRRCS